MCLGRGENEREVTSFVSGNRRLWSMGDVFLQSKNKRHQKKGKKQKETVLLKVGKRRKVACVSSISGLWSQRPPCLSVWWRYERGPTPCPAAAGASAARWHAYFNCLYKITCTLTQDAICPSLSSFTAVSVRCLKVEHPKVTHRYHRMLHPSHRQWGVCMYPDLESD